jgi:hypothetical protein
MVAHRLVVHRNNQWLIWRFPDIFAEFSCSDDHYTTRMMWLQSFMTDSMDCVLY